MLPRELQLPDGPRLIIGDFGAMSTGFPRRLEQQGYAVVGVAVGEAVAETAAAAGAVDAVVLFAGAVDDTLLAVIGKLSSQPGCPIALFCEEGSRDAIQRAVDAGVNAFAVIGVTASRVHSAIDLAMANFRSSVGLREELDEAKQALRERRVIERAKGIVMRRGLDEDAAYKLLRTRAMQRGMRLADVARALTEADDLLG